jgi:hypothetical protein
MTGIDPDLTFTTVRFRGARLNQKLEALDEVPPFPTTRCEGLQFSERIVALD